jgi:hypothetical protein
MSDMLCEGCGEHSFLLPLHGGKGGLLRQRRPARRGRGMTGSPPRRFPPRPAERAFLGS